MNLVKINESISQFCKDKGLKLFEVTYHKNDQILSVLLDEKLDMDQLEDISKQISDYLDRYEDEFEDNYFLDVSTVGVERPIRNEQELSEALGEYIYVKCKDNEYYGTLKSYNDGIMNLEVIEKNKTRNVSIDYKKTKKVRYAVKF
ncbi:MAG: hypothetical protein J6S49_04375 [Erysipelotrichaceae bacterium]|nr:hypothetical protein [Erysipelotrichaceae bacterium]